MNSLATPVFEAVVPLRSVTRSVLYFSCFLFLFAVPGQAQTAVSEQKTMTLEDLQRMALQKNPTFAQSAANIQAAEGRKKQSGLYPNPTVGYQGEQIRGGSFHGGEQGFFIQQDIVLNGSWGLIERFSIKSSNRRKQNPRSKKYAPSQTCACHTSKRWLPSRHWSCANASASLPPMPSRPPINSRMSAKRTLPTCSNPK